MNEILEQYKQDDLIYWFLPIFLLAFLLELIYARRNKLDLHDKSDTIASFWMMIYVVVADLLPKFAAFYVFFYLHEMSPLKDVVGRQWWAWALLFVLDDFTYYCMHRANHEVRWFWAGHVNHHSAIKMNFATALRQGVGERVHKYLFWLPLPLLGFDALMVFTMMSISLFYQFWLHTELVKRLPAPIEFVFNSPSHHRVHHASNVRYLDCNHAGTLIIWDRLLGTFSKEMSDEPPVYGLTHNLESQRPLHVLLHEYQSIIRDVKRANLWRDKLRYLVYAPGWSHDGPDRRAKTLRQALD
ncbi:sterol desaturase family protein [Halioglobus maricola]|uniref:Sterol desaturase family protein n=1 Tax=Halioglobus maricola TaxID=2601894 RepID=A0A5P9NLW5_9GAMM|nr:sterol desaturase family protein [Halioglobus maricola]QFU76853.1 sterol desaturase family protein [Halioglobus maricola]